ncbi:hypothetical protein JCM15519_37100 [Fundidesulfovibrio butyratiphilus]
MSGVVIGNGRRTTAIPWASRRAPKTRQEAPLNLPRLDSYADFSAYLESLGLFHMDMRLDRMVAALAALGLDRPAWTSAQVVGTNGKGSTSTFLAATLAASGVRTGLFTSPHFVDVRERVLVNGAMLDRDDWLEAARAVLQACRGIGADFALTYFELVTVMAAWMFRRHGCRATVFEAGLGGAHDATTALVHHVTLVASVGLDHMALLGPTPADIARDKAGAMRAGTPVVTTAQEEPEVEAVLTRRAGELGVELLRADVVARVHGADWPEVPALPGPHQRANLRLALAGAWLLAQRRGLALSEAAMRQAAREAFLPGRMQWVSRKGQTLDCLLDGAHNQPGLRALASALDQAAIRPRVMVFACLGDKDVPAILPLARALCQGRVVVPQLDAPGRAAEAARLAQEMGPRAEPAASVAQALEMVRDEPGPVLVCGSLYLLAEVYALRPEWLRPGLDPGDGAGGRLFGLASPA